MHWVQKSILGFSVVVVSFIFSVVIFTKADLFFDGAVAPCGARDEAVGLLLSVVGTITMLAAAGLLALCLGVLHQLFKREKL